MVSTRDLFGGAITIELPTSLIDVSTIRQVPDTQEVFVSADSDVSFIVEILAMVEPQNLEDAVRFHFESIAHDNEAQAAEVLNIRELHSPRNKSTVSQTPSPILLDGSQKVAKFNRTTSDDVQVLVALFRVESKKTDIVLTVNIPTKSGGEAIDGLSAVETYTNAFLSAASSLKIMDYGLFAE